MNTATPSGGVNQIDDRRFISGSICLARPGETGETERVVRHSGRKDSLFGQKSTDNSILTRFERFFKKFLRKRVLVENVAACYLKRRDISKRAAGRR